MLEVSDGTTSNDRMTLCLRRICWKFPTALFTGTLSRSVSWRRRLFRYPRDIQHHEAFRLLPPFHVRRHFRGQLLVEQRLVVRLTGFIIAGKARQLLLPHGQLVHPALDGADIPQHPFPPLLEVSDFTVSQGDLRLKTWDLLFLSHEGRVAVRHSHGSRHSLVIRRRGIARARGRFFGYSLLQRGLFPQQSLDFRVAIAVAQPESADLRANALQLRARPLLGRLPWLDRRTGRRILRRAPPGQILQRAHAVLGHRQRTR